MKYIKHNKGVSVLINFRVSYSFSIIELNGKVNENINGPSKSMHFTLANYNKIEDYLNNYLPRMLELSVITEVEPTVHNIMDIVSLRLKGEIKQLEG